jgi:hypothetical protein
MKIREKKIQLVENRKSRFLSYFSDLTLEENVCYLEACSQRFSRRASQFFSNHLSANFHRQS